MKKNLVVAVLLCLIVQFGIAQVPTWSVVPSNYTYSMNVTTQLSVDCIELEDPSDMVGAFVGADCRGVAYTSNVVNGKYLAFLTVYSNSTSGETVTFKIYDASEDVTHDAVTEILFQDGASYGFPTSPFTISTNNQPSDVVLSSSNVAENNLNATVGTLSSVDEDAGSTFTYSFVSGTGDTDNSSFNIAGDQLSVNGILDYETKQAYSVRIETNDGGCSYQKQFSISVTDQNDAPTDIVLSKSDIDENKVSGSVVSTLFTTDEDANENHSYALVAGAGDADNGSFLIVNDELRTASSFNYEVQNSFAIRLQTTDNGSVTYEEAVTITVNDINDKPTDITLNNYTFDENLSLGTGIITITAVDEDANDAHTYVFNNDQASDNNLFAIFGNQIRTNSQFDYETQSYYTIRLSAYDIEGEVYTKQIVLNVNDANDQPTDLFLSNASIFENSTIGTYVGTLSSEDQDAVDSYTYSFVSGNGDADNGSFTISNDSIFTNTLFDFNTKNEYYIRVQTEDAGGLTFAKQDTIHIKNSNDAPTDIDISSYSVEENSAIGTLVGEMTTEDPDIGDGHTYSFVAGVGSTNNSMFSINGNELLTNAVFDFEVKDTFNIRIKTEDYFGASYEEAFEIIIIDVNDVPTAILTSVDTISENLPLNTAALTLSTVDQDTADVHSYSFDNNQTNDNSTFTIVGNELRVTTPIDYESKSVYYLYIKTNDGNGGELVSQKIIFIRDENDAPTAQYLSNNTFDENSNPPTFVGLFSSEDQDAVDTYSYTFTAGLGDDDNNLFSIQADSLFVIDSANFEAKNSYKILVKTTDGGGATLIEQHVITVNDRNDIPTDIEITINELDENNVKHAVVGSFFTTDEDEADTHSYSLVSGFGDDDNSTFYIDGSLLLIKKTTDFETKDNYSVVVRTNDGAGGIFDKQFNIGILDVNEVPTIYDTTLFISENASVNQIIGSLRYHDVDQNEDHSFSVLGNNQFYMLENELVLNSGLNYESVASYTVMVEVEDIGGLTDTAIVEVVVEDEIELDLPLPVNKIMSPNGDNKNDVFFIENVGIYSDYALKIFNNNGFVIYEVDSNYDNSWDGTYGGNIVEQGVYYYLLQSNSDASKFYKGTISLIR